MAYKFVLNDPALLHTERPAVRLSRQMAFTLGLIPFHLGIRKSHSDNMIELNIRLNATLYMDVCCHLTNLSLVSSANTFNFNKIARIEISRETIEGLILGQIPVSTFELSKNWSSITIRNPDLNVCKLHLSDMLNTIVSLFYIEAIIDFNRILVIS